MANNGGARSIQTKTVRIGTATYFITAHYHVQLGAADHPARQEQSQGGWQVGDCRALAAQSVSIQLFSKKHSMLLLSQTLREWNR